MQWLRDSGCSHLHPQACRHSTRLWRSVGERKKPWRPTPSPTFSTKETPKSFDILCAGQSWSMTLLHRKQLRDNRTSSRILSEHQGLYHRADLIIPPVLLAGACPLEAQAQCLRDTTELDRGLQTLGEVESSSMLTRSEGFQPLLQ